MSEHRQRRLSRIPFVLTMIAGGLLFYWEFVHDIEPREALEFYRQVDAIDNADNAAFGFAGLAAPPATPNLHAWGYTQVLINRERDLRGEQTQRILHDEAADDGRLHLDGAASVRQLICWLPGATRGGRDCLEREAVQALLARNRELLARYRSLFGYSALYYRSSDDIGFGNSIGLSRLLVIDYWMRRERLGDEDIEQMFRFFRFWERIARAGNQATVGSAIAIVNYGLAATLLDELSQLDAGLLQDYHAAHGDFFDARVNASDADRLARAEFRAFNPEFCFITEYAGERIPCRQPGRSLGYKPGRTVQLIYQRRLRLEDCRLRRQQRDRGGERVDLAFWGRALLRPGNFRGRTVASLLSGSLNAICELFDDLDRMAEKNRLRNLYLELRRDGYSAAEVGRLYASDRQRFRIPGSERFFDWDAQRGLLIWRGIRNLPDYALPYADSHAGAAG